MVGYCAPGTLGGKLLAGDKNIYLFGDDYEVKADIRSIKSMSAHGDYEDLLRFLSCQDPAQVKQLFLVHGEYNVQLNFAQRLRGTGFKEVEIPKYHQEYDCKKDPIWST